MSRWAKDYAACTECGTARYKHAGHGVCKNCRENSRPENAAKRSCAKATLDCRSYGSGAETGWRWEVPAAPNALSGTYTAPVSK